MIAATTESREAVAGTLAPDTIIETRPGCRATAAHTRPPALERVLTIGVRTTQVAAWPADIVIAGALRA